MTAPGPVSAARPARTAREVLASALGFLQSLAPPSPLLSGAIGALAAASSALYRVESEALTEEAGVSLVCSAVDQLRLALRDLQQAELTDSVLEVPAHAVARALAMLYPLSRAAVRRRRDVMPEGALRDSEIAELRQGAPRSQRVNVAAREVERRQPAEARSIFEVEIGLSSESNFYAGRTRDVSSGGLFVSTDQPAAPGSMVTLFFVLPDGQPVEASGVVRWTRAAAGAGASSGMGVAFTNLRPEDLAAIVRYFGYRAPLLYENE